MSGFYRGAPRLYQASTVINYFYAASTRENSTLSHCLTSRIPTLNYTLSHTDCETAESRARSLSCCRSKKIKLQAKQKNVSGPSRPFRSLASIPVLWTKSTETVVGPVGAVRFAQFPVIFSVLNNTPVAYGTYTSSSSRV